LKYFTKLLSGIFIALSGITPLQAVVEVDHVNTTTVALYEKFEAVINLGDVSYINPYDPDEIDLQAVFTAPSGKEWPIFGFYDDHLNRGEWKIRFSPNEAGLWHYTLTAKTATATEQSIAYQFTAVTSEHHGWIRVSSENPHYLVYDDGTVYYGVGMYTPWRNTIATFDILEEYGANLFGIWNIMYGGLVNGTGIIEEELGRYNQLKCGRIDTLLLISEERGLNCMLAIWPHDLFSATVWAHQWLQNPYNTICDVEDVYSDALCWAYQEKQYRYLIARFAHSRAFGIWEIINEINGTDGWAVGRTAEALNWVQKVHAYFEANDPYRHPTTASRSGGYGEYWPEMYPYIDLPNLHLYESQGWPQKYSGNPLRASLANYAFASLRFWDNFNQPGIFGEAGADLVTFDTHSPEYTTHYHNALWACLTNGLAATPIWWTYNDPIGVAEWQHMAHFSTFVRDIDFVTQSQEHFESTNSDFDIYGMKNDSSAFGWIRQSRGQDISGTQFSLENVLNPEIQVYAISYYNTWTGENMAVHNRPHVDGMLRDVIPDLTTSIPDVAFKIVPTSGGETPTQMELSSDVYQVLNIDTLSVQISCFLFDDQGRFCSQTNNVVTFTLEGPGALSGPTQVAAQNGTAVINFQPTEETGLAQIMAASPGLMPDTIQIRVRDRFILDDFETYKSDTELRSIWPAKSGTTADVYLDAGEKAEGDHSMRLEYAIGPEYKTIARIEKEINQNYNEGKFFSFWIKPDGSNREVEIRIRDKNMKYWIYSFKLTGNTPIVMAIPIDDFSCSTATVPMDLSLVLTLTLTIKKGDGIDGSGTIYFDSFKFPDTAPSEIKNTNNNAVPEQFELLQNYPNPFNASTTIEYRLPIRSQVHISIYNILGQQIEIVVNGARDAGDHMVVWNTSHLASGIYFYKIQADNFSSIKKCGLIK
jgi:hypothetical protein